MRYIGRYSYKRWAFSRRWRATADSATLAHAIHKKRLRKRAMQMFRNAGFTVEGGSVIAPPVQTPVQIVTDPQIGQRAFPEIPGAPNSVAGAFIGEIVHTGGGSWIWTGFSWAPYIYPG